MPWRAWQCSHVTIVAVEVASTMFKTHTQHGASVECRGSFDYSSSVFR